MKAKINIQRFINLELFRPKGAKALHPGYDVPVYFSCGSYNLDSVRVWDNCSGSSFDASDMWIK